jgi:hypothetical protein
MTFSFGKSAFSPRTFRFYTLGVPSPGDSGHFKRNYPHKIAKNLF